MGQNKIIEIMCSFREPVRGEVLAKLLVKFDWLINKCTLDGDSGLMSFVSLDDLLGHIERSNYELYIIKSFEGKVRFYSSKVTRVKKTFFSFELSYSLDFDEYEYVALELQKLIDISSTLCFENGFVSLFINDKIFHSIQSCTTGYSYRIYDLQELLPPSYNHAPMARNTIDVSANYGRLAYLNNTFFLASWIMMLSPTFFDEINHKSFDAFCRDNNIKTFRTGEIEIVFLYDDILDSWQPEVMSLMQGLWKALDIANLEILSDRFT